MKKTILLIFILILSLFVSSSIVLSAQILVKAVDATHIDPVKDRRGAYKRGMPVVVMPDNHIWGNMEGLPTFVVVKIPLISVDKVQKYIGMWVDNSDPEHPITIQRRIWKLRWDDLPQGPKDKLRDNGVLTIKATALYTDTYDYTWTQVKQYFRNTQTGLDETIDLQ